MFLQVAVFDDAVADPVAALLGIASIPLASVVNSIPVEGLFDLIHPVHMQPAGKLGVSIAWHNPIATAAAGAKQLKARIPLLDPAAVAAAAAATAASSSPHMLQQQQQQPQEFWASQQPEALLPSVPMLSPTSRGLQASLPSSNPAAAAAVAAAVGRQQQQQQVPLLHGHAAGDPVAAFSRIAVAAGRPSAVPGGVLLLQGQQLASASVVSASANHRYGNAGGLDQSLDGPLLAADSTAVQAAAAPLLASAGRPLLQPPAMLNTAAGMVGAAGAGANGGNCAGPLPVLRQVSPDPETWGELDTTLYIKVESLQLTEDALRDARLQHVLLAHMFCEDFTSAAQQCTATVLKR